MKEIIDPAEFGMMKNASGCLLSRRQWITGTVGMVALAGLGSLPRALFAQSTYVVTPSMTEGPFFVDEKLNRSDIRLDPSTNLIAAGLSLYLGVTVSQLTNGVITPLTNAYVDIWQANALGKYSDEASEGTVGQKFLRGYQVTGARGTARFLTIYPGWYSGRTVHIHAKVRLYNGSQTTYTYNTQLFFDDTVTDRVFQVAPYSQRGNRNTRNTNDSIYLCNTSVGQSGARMLLRLAADGSHAVGSTHLILNLAGANPGCS